jgi:pimeloyl-ACP methyl ester carboxylesterase
MNFELKGNPNGPLVVCIHGLMGHANDFGPYVDAWGEDFQLLIPSLTEHDTLGSGYGRFYNGEERLVYEFSAAEIVARVRSQFPGIKPFYVGISYGGKICLSIAQTDPDIFGGCAITDVGLGPLAQDSGLFHFIYELIPNINFNQSWAKLRKDLVSKVPDQMLRILIQNHIEYPDKAVPQGQWKGHAKNFQNLLVKSSLENLWTEAAHIAAPIYVFKATDQSAIEDGDFHRMQENKLFKFIVLEGANHFIQINNVVPFRTETLKILRAEVLK